MGNMKILCVFLPAVLMQIALSSDTTQTMLENNYFHAGLLVVNPGDSTWSDWNHPDYMVTRDSTGAVWPFIPPYLHWQKYSYIPKMKSTAEKWFSVLDSDSSARIETGRMMPPAGKPGIPSEIDSAWENEEILDPSSRLNKVEHVPSSKKELETIDRITPVEKVVPE